MDLLFFPDTVFSNPVTEQTVAQTSLFLSPLNLQMLVITMVMAILL